MLKFITQFLKLESTAGLILMIAAALALLIANSSFYPIYHDFFNNSFNIQYGPLKIDKPLLFWINDGLMAIFFFFIGLEIKREWLEGHLSKPAQRILPLIATIAGVVFPAIIYLAFNYENPIYLRGFAIPTATDIAFALGVFTLFAKNVSRSLKIFLLTIAVLDDLSAIVMIAIFYAHTLSWIAFLLALLVLGGLIVINCRRINNISIYLVGTLALWFLVLHSGIHATIAGVLAAFTIPLNPDSRKSSLTAYKNGKDLENNSKSPLLTLERILHPWVAYLILPLFAFANAGLPFKALSVDQLMSSLSLGIILGLFLGKQLGIFMGTFFSVKFKFCQLPDRASWGQVYAISVLCGIGFTMSLFMGTLAFENEDLMYQYILRAGVLIASLSAAILGSILFYFSRKDH